MKFKRRKVKEKKDKAHVRSRVVHVRLNDAEYQAIHEMARHSNLSVSKFIRAVVFQ